MVVVFGVFVVSGSHDYQRTIFTRVGYYQPGEPSLKNSGSFHTPRGVDRPST